MQVLCGLGLHRSSRSRFYECETTFVLWYVVVAVAVAVAVAVLGYGRIETV
jgi:hypothetical protein